MKTEDILNLLRPADLRSVRTEEEILTQLDDMVENYETFQNLISVSKLEDVAGKYIQIAREIAS